MLKPGWRYEVRLCHAGTNGEGDGYPDYDYELLCGNGSLPSNVVVDDPDSLFGLFPERRAAVCAVPISQLAEPEVLAIMPDVEYYIRVRNML